MINDRHSRRDTGFATVEWLFATVFSILILVSIFDVVAIQIQRGVIRNASDSGARAGARVFSSNTDVDANTDLQVSACESKGNDVTDGMGAMAHNKSTLCEVDNGVMRAQTSVNLKGWVPWIPDTKFTATATAPLENELAAQQ